MSALAAAFFWAEIAPKHFSSTELNLYRYCGNDPMDNSDPLGLNFFPYTGDPIPATDLGGGAGMGETVPLVKVVTVPHDNGTFFTLRLDVKIIKIYVAQRMHFKSKTRWTTRSIEEKRVTFEEHEKREHGKDWLGFHDKHQDEIPKTVYAKGDKDSADKAAEALTEKYKSKAYEANKKFNEHQPESRWKPIRDRELPH